MGRLWSRETERTIPEEGPPEAVPEIGTSAAFQHLRGDEDYQRENQRLHLDNRKLQEQLSSLQKVQTNMLEQAFRDHLILEEWSRQYRTVADHLVLEDWSQQYRSRIEGAMAQLSGLPPLPPSVSSSKVFSGDQGLSLRGLAERSLSRHSGQGSSASGPKNASLNADKDRWEQLYAKKAQARLNRQQSFESHPSSFQSERQRPGAKATLALGEENGLPDPKLSTISPARSDNFSNAGSVTSGHRERESTQDLARARHSVRSARSGNGNRRASVYEGRLGLEDRYHQKFQNTEDRYKQFMSPVGLVEAFKQIMAESWDQGKKFLVQKLVRDVTARSSMRGSVRRSTRVEAPLLNRVLEHPAFDISLAIIIILNSALLGVYTQWQIDHNSDPKVFHILEYIFTFIYLAELLLRTYCYGCGFFCERGWQWNIFDAVIVLTGLIQFVFEMVEEETVMSKSSEQIISKTVHMMRLLRVVRIVRVLRFLAELRMMVGLVFHSIRSLFWLLVLLIMLLYVYSIILTQAVRDYMTIDIPDPALVPILDHYFGGIGNTLYTLFGAITGGLLWMDIVAPMDVACGRLFSTLLVTYIFLGVFCILNVVTGIYVDESIQRSAQERDLRLEKEQEGRELYESMLLDLLAEIDYDGTGEISREMLEEAFENDRVKYYFQVLDIDVSDSNYLFDMLDKDRSGAVDIEEFITGCIQLKGAAKSIDVHTLMHEMRLIMSKWDLRNHPGSSGARLGTGAADHHCRCCKCKPHGEQPLIGC